jgi:hypothetical protein
LGTTETNQNDVHDEIKSSLKSGMIAVIQSKIFVFPSHIKKPKYSNMQNCNLLVVLYVYQTWFFTLEEEHRQRFFENRTLRRIFGPEREEDRSWRKLDNDELHRLYSSS